MATSMEEIKLINAETNTEYSLIVSPEEANKARNDINFAYFLLEYAKSNCRDDSEEEESKSDNLDNSVPSTSSCSRSSEMSDHKDHHIWTKSETLLFINMYKEYTSSCKKTVPAKKGWLHISRKLKEAGYDISPTQCSTKFHCLKRTYKTVSDHNKKSGNSRKQWEFYEVMQEIFGKNPWAEPLSTAGSGITNNDVQNDEPKVKRKRKIVDTIATYFEESMKFKKERELNVQKRHEEKMKYLAEIKALIMSKGNK